MEWQKTLEIKSLALKFCSDALKCISDLSLEAQTNLDGERVQDEYIRQIKTIRKLCDKNVCSITDKR